MSRGALVREGAVARGPQWVVTVWPGKKGNGSGPNNISPFLFIQKNFKRLELI
jgi:hypothetical protein